MILVENTMAIIWRNIASHNPFFFDAVGAMVSDALIWRLTDDSADRALRALVSRIFDRGGRENLDLPAGCGGRAAVQVTCSRRSFVRLGGDGGNVQCERMLLVWRLGFPESPAEAQTEILAEALGGERPSLSAVETRLVLHLADGKTVRQASDLMNISYHTGRKYLQTIFAKTGARRQAELVARLASGQIILSSRDRRLPLL